MSTAVNGVVQCVVCGEKSLILASERGRVHSNVRAYRDEVFGIWRCRSCLCLHASDELELARYYSNYPFHRLPSDARTDLLYDNQLSRLRQAGLEREHRILDYGCGNGAFVRYLQSRGYLCVYGYDEFSEDYGDEKVLKRTYDMVLSQDVIEHVPDPNEFLSGMARLIAPGGIVAIGTPNAEAIDLSRSARYVHALHLPYHRHILSKRALIVAGERQGWTLVHYYPKQYANTRFPFLNAAFYLYYMRLLDGTLDSLIEPPRLMPLLLRLPLTLFWGLFGYFLSEETDVMAIFRNSCRDCEARAR
jgi:2-polyprenyl-3-methyl-5-hydroxy-6-metoxy-1,4-benzoquinol methylase